MKLYKYNKYIQKSFVLTKVFRQKELGFTKILEEIREGFLSERGRKLLSRCGKKSTIDGVIPTKLFAINKYVEATNDEELRKLKGKAYIYDALDTGDESLQKFLSTECTAPSKLILKEGCQVVLLRNLSVETGLCNGTRGVVTSFVKSEDVESFSEYYPVVKFLVKSGTVEIAVKEEVWLVEEKNKSAQRIQIPLKLVLFNYI